MAVPTGSGTETLHSHMFEDIDTTGTTLIFGVQHHTYTVLSVIAHCIATQAATNKYFIRLIGYDAKGGVSNQNHRVVAWTMVAGETFVWNDKFSFFGAEGTASGSAMDAANQIVIAAQAAGVVQSLMNYTDNASDDCEVICTYLDQDWT